MSVSLCKHAGAALHYIWSPRYHDNRVLIKCSAIRDHNLITFTKANIDGWHYVSGKVAKSYPKQTNGSVMCYAIPMAKLEDFEPVKNCEHQL